MYTLCLKLGLTDSETEKHQIWHGCSKDSWGDSLVLPHLLPSEVFCVNVPDSHLLPTNTHIHTLCLRECMHIDRTSRTVKLSSFISTGELLYMQIFLAL